MAIPVVESRLASPADLEHLRGDTALVLSQRVANRRLEASVMCRLADNVTERAVASEGKALGERMLHCTSRNL